MAAPGDGGDFTFAPAAAEAPLDPTVAAAAAAAAAAAVPTQAEVEDELLARFKDQLEAVMEESLGPLLASGGALDPEMARKIARETSAPPAPLRERMKRSEPHAANCVALRPRARAAEARAPRRAQCSRVSRTRSRG